MANTSLAFAPRPGNAGLFTAGPEFYVQISTSSPLYKAKDALPGLVEFPAGSGRQAVPLRVRAEARARGRFKLLRSRR